MSAGTTREAVAWEAASGELRDHLKVVRVAARGSRRSPWRSSALELADTYPFPVADLPDNRGWARVAAEVMRRHNPELPEPDRRARGPRSWFATVTYDGDPRGWANLVTDWVEFTVTDGHTLMAQLNEVGWRAASECLRTLAWEAVARVDERAIEAAETLLGRFGRRARYYANDSPTPLAARDHDPVRCSNGLVTVAGDVGPVVVAEDEVGVFWSAADA
ncbi:hypothetical protein ACIBSV_00130 [Embleya sp. NPDC050154]|uniref:hypothetical protein n=1 Tax=Embleya sp. NPDC050154 TaxID=3363988 RepID=UPI0037B4330E